MRTTLHNPLPSVGWTAFLRGIISTVTNPGETFDSLGCFRLALPLACQDQMSICPPVMTGHWSTKAHIWRRLWPCANAQVHYIQDCVSSCSTSSVSFVCSACDWAPEWRSGLRHRISVQEASLPSLVRNQAVSHLAEIGSPIGWRTIGPVSSRFGRGRPSL